MIRIYSLSLTARKRFGSEEYYIVKPLIISRRFDLIFAARVLEFKLRDDDMKGNRIGLCLLGVATLGVSIMSLALPSKISPAGGCPADYSLFTIEKAVIESKKDNPEHDAAWFTREVDRNADGYICGLKRIFSNPDGTKWIDNKSSAIK